MDQWYIFFLDYFEYKIVCDVIIMAWYIYITDSYIHIYRCTYSWIINYPWTTIDSKDGLKERDIGQTLRH